MSGALVVRKTLGDLLDDPLVRGWLAPMFTPVIFNTLRVLKRVNPGDTYLENYLDKYYRDPDFFDQYHLAWVYGSLCKPTRILEIGTRTGLSLCQLLSSLISYEGVEAHCFDLFNDGFVSPKLVELNLKALNIPTNLVTFHVGDSAQTVPQFLSAQASPPLFDWVLVDGSHDKTAARIDLENVAPAVAPGGLLVFDDISTAPGECALIDVWEQFKHDYSCDDTRPDGLRFVFGEDMSGKGTGWAIRQ